MIRQPLGRRRPLLPRHLVVAVDLAQSLQHIAALQREVVDHHDKIPSAVSQAVGQQQFQSPRHFRHVPRQRVAIWIGGGSSGARRFNTSARFSPAGLSPVKNRAIFCPAAVATIPDVNTPVRSSPVSRFSCSILAVVSSLYSTSPCAACRINSSCAGAIDSAASSTISHCVEAGNGIPRFSCSPSSRWNGTPLPYFRIATMLADVSSYLSSPTPSGAGASNTSWHRLQRILSSPYTVAWMGACPTILTRTAGSFSGYSFPFPHSVQRSPLFSVGCATFTFRAPGKALAGLRPCPFLFFLFPFLSFSPCPDAAGSIPARFSVFSVVGAFSNSARNWL